MTNQIQLSLKAESGPTLRLNPKLEIRNPKQIQNLQIPNNSSIAHPKPGQKNSLVPYLEPFEKSLAIHGRFFPGVRRLPSLVRLPVSNLGFVSSFGFSGVDPTPQPRLPLGLSTIPGLRSPHASAAKAREDQVLDPGFLPSPLAARPDLARPA
jgi:hypothetical protein